MSKRITQRSVDKRFVFGAILLFISIIFIMFECSYGVQHRDFELTDSYSYDKVYDWGTFQLGDGVFSVIEQFIYYVLALVGFCGITDFIRFKGKTQYDYVICNKCEHYKQKDNKMVCMMCIDGSEFTRSDR